MLAFRITAYLAIACGFIILVDEYNLLQCERKGKTDFKEG